MKTKKNYILVLLLCSILSSFSQITWQRTYGSIYGDYGNNLFETKDHHVIAIGTFRRINLDNSITNLLTIKKYQYNTTLIWEREYELDDIIRNDIGAIYTGVDFLGGSNFYYNMAGNLCFDVVAGKLHLEIDENTGLLLKKFTTKAYCNMVLEENSYELFTDASINHTLDIYLTETDTTYRHTGRIVQSIYPFTAQIIHTYLPSQIRKYKDKIFILTDLSRIFIDTRPEVDPVLESSSTILYVLDTQLNFINQLVLPRNTRLEGSTPKFISIEDDVLRIKYTDLTGFSNLFDKIVEVDPSTLSINNSINTRRTYNEIKYKNNEYLASGNTSDTTLIGFHINRTDVWASDGIIAKYDSNGTELSYQLYGGSSYDYLKDAIPTIDGGIFAIASPISIDGDIISPIITPGESQYMWVFKVGGVVNSMNDIKSTDYSKTVIYPNPMIDYFNILLDENNDNNNILLNIYNANGELVFYNDYKNNTTKNILVDMPVSLSSGLYYYEIIGNKIYQGKLFKQ